MQRCKGPRFGIAGAYSYADDVARGLATLGEHPHALGQVWHLPVAPAESTRALFTRVANALELPLRVRAVPTWIFRAAGLFDPFMREAAEMNYQWKVPYVVDDTRFQTTFGTHATPLERPVAATAAWARSTHAPDRAGHQVSRG